MNVNALVFGSGARRDVRSHPAVQAQRSVGALLRKIGASSTPRGSADLSQYRPPISNQTSWEDCTAEAASACVEQRLAVKGTPLGWRPSKAGIWTNAILIENPGLSVAQLASYNGGVQSVSAMMSVGMGIRPMGPETSPGSNTDVGAPVAPGLDLATVEGMTPIVGEYRIDTSDPSWPETAAVCLDNGIPVWVAMDVGVAYQSWVSSMPPINTAETGASSGHAMRLDKYETAGTSTRIFSAPGSWGLGVADQGVWLFTSTGLVLRTFDSYPYDVN